MDDEEAKRIQEERDKKLTEEYKELQNPKNPDYNKIINEVIPLDWDEIDPSMKGTDPVGDLLTFGAAAATTAVAKPLVGALGVSNVIDAGLNMITGESDTAFEKKLELFKPAKVAVKSTRIFKDMLTNVFDRRVEKADPVYAMSDGINPMRIPEIPENIGTQMMRSGLKDGIFQLDIWRANSSYRKTMEAFQTDPNLAVKISGKNSLRTILMPDFLKEFGPYLKKMKQVPGSIDLHHIFGLNLSAPIYDGLRFDSPEYLALQNLFKEYNIIPGNTKKNLMLALEEPHDLLHQQFFKDKIGYRGEKFFTKARLNKIKFSEAGRLEVAREYAEIVKQGEDLITRATDQIQAVFGTTSVKPERLADVFSEALADGTTNIFKEGYTIKSVDKQVKKWMKEIVPDYAAGNVKTAIPPKTPSTEVPLVKGKTIKEQDLARLADLRKDLNAKGKTRKQKDLDLAEIAELEAKYEAKQQPLFSPKNIVKKKKKK